jgi:hypothetical protein
VLRVDASNFLLTYNIIAPGLPERLKDPNKYDFLHLRGFGQGLHMGKDALGQW